MCDWCVILQHPSTGTIVWGPFEGEEAADGWIESGEYARELLARCGSPSLMGMVVFACPIYQP